MMASMTKLMTSISALQVVEKGIIGLDDDVSSLIPALGKQPILTGYDGDKPILETRQKAITLRLVAVHMRSNKSH